MTRIRRLAAAVTGALLLSGLVATPAMAAPSTGALTITPKAGQLQFGAGNPADALTIVPVSPDCPAGSELYLDVMTLPGSEGNALTAGVPLTVGGTINRNPANPTLTVPSHAATFQTGQVQTLLTPILPFGTTDAQLSPADAAKPVGTVIAEGAYSVFGICLNSSFAIIGQSEVQTVTLKAATRAPKPANWPDGQFYDVLQWSFSFGAGGGEGPAATTVTLSASPAGSAPSGAPVSLTASVSPADATGSVTFLDGTTALGTKAVTAGAASLTTGDLPVGARALSAVFTPDDTAAFDGSTGTLSYQITAPNPGGSQTGQVTIRTTVPSVQGGDLTLTVDQTGAVALPEAVRDGDDFVTGQNAVNLVTVTDNRADSRPGWNVSGAVADAFTGADPAHTFDGGALGWVPLVVAQTAGQGVTAGPAVTAGGDQGLKSPGSTLALAQAGSGVGTAKLGADLSLLFPVTTPADTYSAVITITLI